MDDKFFKTTIIYFILVILINLIVLGVSIWAVIEIVTWLTG